jgi:hypothetical protein
MTLLHKEIQGNQQREQISSLRQCPSTQLTETPYAIRVAVLPYTFVWLKVYMMRKICVRESEV